MANEAKGLSAEMCGIFNLKKTHPGISEGVRQLKRKGKKRLKRIEAADSIKRSYMESARLMGGVEGGIDILT